MTNEQSLIPPVIWAQRNTVVFVTICVEDCKNPEIKIESEQIVFRGVAGLQQKVYAITIPLYAPVDTESSKITVGGRYIELVLEKCKDDDSYWPHLTKEKKKFHWLKVDFKKWKDEDDSEDESATAAAGAGGLGGLGGGMGGDGNIDDMLSMMGGGGPGGIPSQYGNLGDLGADTDDDSDDEEEMPGLDDIESENAGKGKDKSEEDLKVKPEPNA